MIVRFGYWLVLLTVCCVTLANSEVYTDEVEFDNNTFVDNVPFQSDCDCGKFSRSCSYVEGKKKCICYDLYADKQGTCVSCYCKNANYYNRCEFDDSGSKKCNCLKGYAELNGDCQECNCGEHGNCILYAWGKTCRCENGYADNYGTCKECDCGEHGICSFSAEYKQCSCDSKFAENDFGKCEACDCGENASLLC
ncbi:hypothetical protein JTE90_002445 [Oedothorax gibbosus]|uniref:Tenascin-X n=1 Tax=Oedothorax gibbosus TaxID=931172 RepID=A0AAV6UVE2_9ARAC|nr:hypothetical protein JTE90_002445 [Oedothorax gibbosus]